MTVIAEEDQERVARLESLGALNDPRRPELVVVVELAALICQVPMATINLITATEQHQIAAYGFDGGICRREDSMCARILKDPGPVHVPDARLDGRFKDNPFVNGELGAVRLYAAHQLTTRDGVVIGSLCVFDDKVGELDSTQQRALRTLAERVVDVFELGRRNVQLRHAMIEMETLRSRLERSNDRLLAFAGQVTHDLKTPLTTMALSLELIRDELELGATSEDLVPLINRALGGSARMTKMIEDVLSFARLGTHVDPVATDLAVLAREAVEDLAAELAEAELTIGELPTVYGDEALLRSVLQNLISNAVKFHPAGTTPQVSVTSRREGQMWRIEVTDNGIGVPEDQHERIFEPMVRLDKAYDGVGVGLATCVRVVDAHDGQIGIINNPNGAGSTFWVELPA